MTNNKKRICTYQLTDEDALKIGKILGYVDKVAKTKARRFYSYLKGDIKNWDYDDVVHYGDISKKILPVIEILQKNNYYLPNNK